MITKLFSSFCLPKNFSFVLFVCVCFCVVLCMCVCVWVCVCVCLCVCHIGCQNYQLSYQQIFLWMVWQGRGGDTSSDIQPILFPNISSYLKQRCIIKKFWGKIYLLSSVLSIDPWYGCWVSTQCCFSGRKRPEMREYFQPI